MKIFIIFCVMLSGLFAQVQRLDVQLNWSAQFEFAGFYMAKELGYYKDAGLDVVLHHFDPSHAEDIKSLLLQKKVDVGVYSSAILYEAVATKQFQVLSYLFQSSPQIAYAHKAPQKLRNKGCLYLSSNEYNSAIDVLMRKFGITCRKVYDLEAFKKDTNGIITSFNSNESYTLKNYYLVEPKKYGVDFYEDIIFAESSYYKNHKRILREFVLATLKGWRYALTHIKESAELIHKKYATHKSLEWLEYEAHKILEHSIWSVEKVGIFNREKLKHIQGLYKECGLLLSSKNIDTVIDPLFIDWVDFSWEERAIIAQTKIRYSETMWPPFSIIDKEKNISGIGKDFLDVIAQKSGLEMEFIYKNTWSEVIDDIKCGALDMAMATGLSPQKNHFAIFSKTYGKFAFGIATKRDTDIDTFDDIVGKTIAVGKDYTAHELLKKYNGVIIKPVVSTKEALYLLHKGEVDGVIDVLPTLSYYMATQYYKDMIIAATTSKHFAMRAMFRKDLEAVKNIFDKTLATIPKEKRIEIIHKYKAQVIYMINEEKEFYFKLFIGALLVIIVLVLFIILRLKKELLQKEIVQNKLQTLVDKDSLTGLYNRRFFHELTQREEALLRRNGGKIVFGIIDIDNFKLYNDYYGHLEGDVVLQKVAKTIQETCKRKSDFIFRLGGEEFGIYLHVEDEKNIEKFLMQILENVRKLNIAHVGNAPYNIVTISLGAVIVNIEKYKPVSILRIYKKADELMYRAKEGGKNQMILEEIQL
jgi:polar amino acid transport system substrate-binding protein